MLLFCIIFFKYSLLLYLNFYVQGVAVSLFCATFAVQNVIMFFVLFIFVFIAYIAANRYIYRCAVALLPKEAQRLRIAVKVFMYCVVAMLPIGFFLSGLFPPSLARVCAAIGNVWLLFTFYMFLALLVCKPLERCFNRFKWRFPLALTFTVGILVFGYVNYRTPKVIEQQIALDNGLNDSVRIVGISDVHLGYATGKAQLRDYVDMINAQNPDVVIISGDLCDNNFTPLFEEAMYEELREIDAPQGVYMVPGNHEYISGVDDAQRFARMANITLLRDNIAVLPCGLHIIGRDDVTNRNRSALSDLVSSIPTAAPTLLLDHNPKDASIDEAVELGVDIQLYGHTHSGQVWPVTYIVEAMYNQPSGYRFREGSHVIVSGGLSLWGPPFRIGTDSELWVLTVK